MVSAAAAEFPAQSDQAGRVRRLRLPSGDGGAIEVITPTGKNEQLGAAATSVRLSFADTAKAVFTLSRAPAAQGRFAVNLFDEIESQILPRVNLALRQRNARQRRAAAAKPDFPSGRRCSVVVMILLALELFLALSPGSSALSDCRCAAPRWRRSVLALVNPRHLQIDTGLDVVLGVDLSRSVGQEGREKALGDSRSGTADEKHRRAHRHCSPSAARRNGNFCRVLKLPTTEFASRLDREETDIQAALQAALAQAGDGRQEKILLISDGNENRGEVARVLPLLRAQGVQVWTLPVSLSRGRNEIYLSDLTLPRQVDSAEGFRNPRRRSKACARRRRALRLLRDGALHAEREMRLNPGANSIVFPRQPDGARQSYLRAAGRIGRRHAGGEQPAARRRRGERTAAGLAAVGAERKPARDLAGAASAGLRGGRSGAGAPIRSRSRGLIRLRSPGAR